jgi:hypothetical protein
MRGVSFALGVGSLYKQALPARFISCDYEFNSLSFLPTAPGPKLM